MFMKTTSLGILLFSGVVFWCQLCTRALAVSMPGALPIDSREAAGL